jgi:hypothetical protein
MPFTVPRTMRMRMFATADRPHAFVIGGNRPMLLRPRCSHEWSRIVIDDLDVRPWREYNSVWAARSS